MSQILTGQHLGTCTLLEQLGTGGMATVYRAMRDDGIVVAVKVIAPQLIISPEFVRRFQREARAMQAFEHPYILPVYELGQQDGVTFLTMAVADGGDLRDYLYEHDLPLPDLIDLLEKIASALDYAHEQGVVHRDLKPANVLMSKEQHPYLSDFGLAKFKEESVGLTTAGAMLGTPSYMAPEQWRSEPVDTLTDIYAFGVMIFEALCGQLPFENDNLFALMYSHLDDPPPAISRIRPELPPTLDRVVQRAMAKVPEQRYPSAGGVITALREAAQPAQPNKLLANVLDVAGLDDLLIFVGKPVDAVTAEAAKPAAPTPQPSFVTEYDVVDVGARVLLERAKEAVRELPSYQSTLAQAVVVYVQNLRQQAKRHDQILPYRALESYDISDHRLFYGRETAIDEMLARLPRSKLIVLHAESGAGKTSLVRAGLMPRLLAGGYLPLYVAVRRGTPQEAIKQVLLPDVNQTSELRSASLRTYLKTMAQIVGNNRDIFIFLDQFETLFTDVFDEGERQNFVSEIAECLDDPLLPLRLVLVLRTEYFGQLAKFQPEIPQPFANEYLLQALSPDEARRALVQPASDKGYKYGDGVVETLLQDLGDENGTIAPPQLQLVGEALIDALPPERQIIELEDYLQAGRAEGVLRDYLEMLLNRLPSEDRQLARRVIEALVRADQTRDVRTYRSLQSELQAHNEVLTRVLNELRENRVLRLYESDSEIVYELVHDYLARQIQLDPQTIARKAAQELLNRRTSDFERYGSLLTAQELSIINAQLSTLMLSPAAATLIAATQAQHRRQRRTLIGLVTTTIVGVLAALIGGLIVVQQESANRQQQLEISTTSEARIATERDAARLTESQMLASLAQEQLTTDPVASLNLGIASMTPLDRPYVPEAEFALSQAVQRSNERLYLPSAGAVLGAAWSADQQKVLTWSADKTTRIFDAQDGSLLQIFPSPAIPLRAEWLGGEVRIIDSSGNILTFESTSGAVLSQVATGVMVNGALETGSQVFLWSDEGGELWDGDKRLWSINQPSIRSVVWNVDGSALLTVDDTRAVVRDAVTGVEQNSKEAHTAFRTGAVWDPTGTRVLSFRDDNQAVLWDEHNGDILLTLEGHSDALTSASWSPDHSLIVTTGFDGQVILWDAASGTEHQRLRTDNVVDGVLWDRKSSRLVVYGEADSLTLWNFANNQVISLTGHNDTVLGAVWNSDESLLLTYSQDGDALVWDTNGVLVASMRGHQAALTSAVFSADSDLVLTSAMDGSARLWVLRDNGVIVGSGLEREFTSWNSATLAAAWNNDETRIASTYADGTLMIWDTTSNAPPLILSEHTDQVRHLAWSSDGRWVLTAGDDDITIVWDVNSGTATYKLVGHTAPLTTARWRTDRVQVLTASEDGTVRLWQDGQEQQHFDAGSSVWDAVWIAGNTQVLGITADGRLLVWDVATGHILRTLSLSTVPLLGVEISPDETQWLAWGYDGLAHVIDAASGDEIARLQGHTDWVIEAQWNHVGTQIATVSSDGTARVWENGVEIQRMEGHTDSVIGLMWNSNDTRLLTYSVDGTARIWNVDSGKEVLQLAGHRGRVRFAAWSHDERTILTAGDDGTVRLWQAWTTSAELVDAAMQKLSRLLTPEQRHQFFLSESNADITEIFARSV